MIDEPAIDEDKALAAEYALGLLSSDEARAFEARLAVDPVLRAEYAVWAEDFATLLDSAPPVAAPASVRAGVERRLFPDDAQPWWRRLGLIPALAGALAAALIVVFFAGNDWFRPGGPTLTAQIAAEDASLIVLAAYDPDAGELTLSRQAGAVREGRVQELWLIAGDAAPVSLGLIGADGGTLTVSETLAALLPGATLAISDEPPGGSPTGQPTGAVLAVGTVTTL